MNGPAEELGSYTQCYLGTKSSIGRDQRVEYDYQGLPINTQQMMHEHNMTL